MGWTWAPMHACMHACTTVQALHFGSDKYQETYIHVYLCIYMWRFLVSFCEQRTKEYTGPKLHNELCSLTASGCLCYTADMPPVSHSRHICYVRQQECLLCHTADMSAVSHTADVSVGHTAEMSAVSHSRHVCCVPQQIILRSHTADVFAASHS